MGATTGSYCTVVLQLFIYDEKTNSLWIHSCWAAAFFEKREGGMRDDDI